MKKFSKILLLSVLSVFLVAGSATAIPFGDGGAGLQGVLDGITTVPVGDSSVDVTTDALTDPMDSYWSVTATGGAIETIIVEIAQWKDTNTFGIYDMANSANTIEVFNGLAGAGSQAAIGIAADGSVLLNFLDTGVDFGGNAFGFYLDSIDVATAPWSGGMWYSDTALNADGQDHMAAYQGTGDTVQLPGLAPGTWTVNEYVLAFEDLDAQHWGDQNGTNDGFPEWSDTEPDFTDFVVMVESVNPVPEPATMLLLGTGLFGLAVIGRKKFIKKS